MFQADPPAFCPFPKGQAAVHTLLLSHTNASNVCWGKSLSCMSHLCKSHTAKRSFLGKFL